MKLSSIFGAVLILGGLVGPVAAMNSKMLEAVSRDLKSDKLSQNHRAAMAACLAALGDAAKTAKLFTSRGWSVAEDVAEDTAAGVSEFSSAPGGVTVQAALDGSFCAVSSDAIGYATAIGAIQIISGIGELKLREIESANGCLTFQLSESITGQLTAAGNDALCIDDNSSTWRFELGAGS